MSTTQKQPPFQNVTISADEYRGIRQLTSDASKAVINGYTTQQLTTLRRKLVAVRAKVTANKERIPVVYFQYTKRGQTEGKRWAFRKALNDTIALIDERMKALTNFVSPLLEEPAEAPAHAEVADDENVSEAERELVAAESKALGAGESPYLDEDDDLPL